MEDRTPENTMDTGALPKLCGADVELGNFILGVQHGQGTGRLASRALLRHMPGAAVEVDSWGGSSGGANWWFLDDGWGGGRGYGGATYNPQDWGRRYLPANGGCAYIDLDHLELCLPEVLSAYDHVAAWQAMLIIARGALERANAALADGGRVMAFANNSDGLGNSYGGHVNFLVSRRCFDNIFHRKLHYLLFLASYLTSSIVLTGAGKVGSENGRPEVGFQLSQRADFYETLTGIQTTYNRPIVNSRDESLCGRPGQGPARAANGMARLHVIFFDTTLCQVASLLKVGVTQLVLAMVEQDRVPGLMLEDPLRALLEWSHDPSLRAKARLVGGEAYTAVDVQQAILEAAARFVEEGRADGLVPRAGEIVACWAETLELLRRLDVEALASRLDWALKLCILRRAAAGRGLAWDAPALKHLDLMYSSIDPADGLYWACERGGAVRRVVSGGSVERFVHEPPDDTRAYLRAHLLRLAGQDAVSHMDWDHIRFRFPKDGRKWPTYRYVEMGMEEPLAWTRARCGESLERAGSLPEALTLLGAQETDSWGHPPKTAPVGPRLLPGVTAQGQEGLCRGAGLPEAGNITLEGSSWEDQQGGTYHA